MTNDVGAIAIHRLRRDGRIDRSFGSRGQIVIAVTAGGPIAKKRAGGFRYAGVDAVPTVGATRDGKVVVVGNFLIEKPGRPSRQQMAALRFNADGTIDRSFGANGRALLDRLGPESFASSFVLRRNGSMVLGGHGFRSGRSFLAFASLRPDGTLDSRFGRHGLARVGFGSGSTVVGSGLVLQDGFAVAVGSLLMETGRLTVLVDHRGVNAAA